MSGLKLLEEGYEGVALNKIFPARNFKHSGDGGAWYAAKIIEDEEAKAANRSEKPVRTYSRLKKERRRESKKQRLYDRGEEIPDDTQSMMDEAATHLDGFFLLRTHNVTNPNDLSVVNISGRPLETANDDDLNLFESVAYVNASETFLRLDTFKNFPGVKELEAPLCGLRGININLSDFPQLALLDLSYNNLSGADVGALSVLPSLRALYLTGNQLKTLPDTLSSNVIFKSETGDESEEVEAFPRLEVLHLDDNNFTDSSVFALLAGLKQLKSLNLDNNKLASIPYIKVVSKPPPVERTQVFPSDFPIEDLETSKEDEFDTNLDDLMGDLSTPQPDEKSHPEPADDTEAPEAPREETEQEDAIQTLALTSEDTQPESEPEKPSQPPPPFPDLRILSMANNKIESEDGVLPVVGWPMLQEVNLAGNPLVERSKGEPPLLKRYLTNRLGIHVKRFDDSQKLGPPKLEPISNPQPPPRHIPEVIPPMKKRPIDFMAIEYPGIFDPLPSRDPTALQLTREVSEEVMTPGSRPPEVRPVTQPLPPIGEDSSYRPASGPGDYQHLRMAPPEMHRLDTQEVLSAASTSSKGHKPATETAAAEGQDEAEPFFLTQMDDAGEQELVDMSEQPEQEGEASRRRRLVKRVPEKLKAYELLYTTDEDEERYSINLPKDVQSNVKALKYALKHPLVVDGRSHGPRDQAVMHLYQPDKYRRPGKPKVVHKSKTELFYDTLADIKRRVANVETNVENLVLADCNLKPPGELRQVHGLMHQIQAKYHTAAAASSSTHS